MKKYLIFLTLAIFPFLGFSQSSNAYWSIKVDSSMNYDITHTVTVILKPNHGISIFSLVGQYANLCTYQTSSYYLLQQPTVNTTVADTFTYVMPTVGNGNYLYTISTTNTTVGIVQIQTIQNNKPIKILTNSFLSVDSAINNNNTARLRVTLPTISNVGRIVLRQYTDASSANFTTITQTPTYTSNPPNNVDFNITKTPGTYYYRAFLRRRAFLFPTLDTCEYKLSNATIVTFNPPPVVPNCAPSNLTILNNQTTKFRYRFTLNSNCPNPRKGYEARFYRLLDTDNNDAQNPNLPQSILPSLKTANVQYKNVTDIETLSSSRITLTQQEINQGYFERDVAPKITFYGWYRIDIVCATCPYPNKLITKYVFVTI
jgi:hypothetical protein